MKEAVQVLEPYKRPIPRHAAPCPSPFWSSVEEPPAGKLSAVGDGSTVAVGTAVTVGIVVATAVAVGETSVGWVQATKREAINVSKKIYFVFM